MSTASGDDSLLPQNRVRKAVTEQPGKGAYVVSRDDGRAAARERLATTRQAIDQDRKLLGCGLESLGV